RSDVFPALGHFLQSPLDVAYRTTLVGCELPEQGPVERVRSQVRVGGDGLAQSRLTVLDTVLAVKPVQGGKLQPRRPLRLTASALGGVLHHGERYVIVALGQRLVRRLEFGCPVPPEQHGDNLPLSSVLHEISSTVPARLGDLSWSRDKI